MRIFGKRKEPGVEALESNTDDREMTAEEFEAALESARAEGLKAGQAQASNQGAAARDAETKRIAEIRQRCSAVQLLLPAGFADTLITEGVTTEALGDRIVNAIAAQAAKAATEHTEINGHVSPSGSPGENPLLVDAKKRAQAAQKGVR